MKSVDQECLSQKCICPALGTFVLTWNDGLPDEDKTKFILPLIPKLAGTRGSKSLEKKRSLMAADWLVRQHLPAWVGLAGLQARADAIANLLEITSIVVADSIKDAIDAARHDVNASFSAAKSSNLDRNMVLSRIAARAATWDGTMYAALTCANLTITTLVLAAKDVAMSAAWLAVLGNADFCTADATLKPTQLALQESALALINRMIEATE